MKPGEALLCPVRPFVKVTPGKASKSLVKRFELLLRLVRPFQAGEAGQAYKRLNGSSVQGVAKSV